MSICQRSEFWNFWVTSAALALAILPCAAVEEGQQCPDMPTHRQVLEEGREVDRKNPAPRTGGGGGGGGGARRGTVLPGALEYSFGAPAVETAKTSLPEEKIDTLGLSKAQDVHAAGEYADVYVDNGNFAAAEKLYKRMLQAQTDRLGPKSIDVAEVLEDLGAVEILLDSPQPRKSEPLQRLPSDDFGDLYNFRLPQLRRPSHSLMESARKLVLGVVKVNAQTTGAVEQKPANGHWLAAMDYYQQAISIRKATGFTDVDLASTYVELAALHEWKGDLQPASFLYHNALDINVLANDPTVKHIWADFHSRAHLVHFISAADAFVDFCARRRSWDDARNGEEDLVKLAGEMQSQPLISLIAVYEHNERWNDAARLFKETLLLRDLNGKLAANMPASVIVPMLDHMQTDSWPVLTQYLLEIESVKARRNFAWAQSDSEFAKKYLAYYFKVHHDEQFPIVLAMEKHGKISQAQSILIASVQEPLNKYDVQRLVDLAQFYERNGQDIKLPLLYERILRIIEKEYPSKYDEFEERIHLLKILRSGISNAVCERNGQCRSVRARVANLQNHYIQEAQKRQCLDIADQLNNTAAELENKELFTAATKLYNEALDIKLKKLGPTSSDTAFQYGELARVAAKQNRFTEAQALYLKALDVYHLHKEAAHDCGVLLESYAQFLEKNHHDKQAKVAFDQARETFRKVSERSKN